MFGICLLATEISMILRLDKIFFYMHSFSGRENRDILSASGNTNLVEIHIHA